MTVRELKILLSNYPDSAKVYNSGEKDNPKNEKEKENEKK